MGWLAKPACTAHSANFSISFSKLILFRHPVNLSSLITFQRHTRFRSRYQSQTTYLFQVRETFINFHKTTMAFCVGSDIVSGFLHPHVVVSHLTSLLSVFQNINLFSQTYSARYSNYRGPNAEHGAPKCEIRRLRDRQLDRTWQMHGHQVCESKPNRVCRAWPIQWGQGCHGGRALRYQPDGDWGERNLVGHWRWWQQRLSKSVRLFYM